MKQTLRANEVGTEGFARKVETFRAPPPRIVMAVSH
jgi:hypothetical protein